MTNIGIPYNSYVITIQFQNALRTAVLLVVRLYNVVIDLFALGLVDAPLIGISESACLVWRPTTTRAEHAFHIFSTPQRWAGFQRCRSPRLKMRLWKIVLLCFRVAVLSLAQRTVVETLSSAYVDPLCCVPPLVKIYRGKLETASWDSFTPAAGCIEHGLLIK